METVSQSIGSDLLAIVSSNLASVPTGSIAAGAEVIVTVTLTPSDQILGVWNLFHSFYIDTDNNDNYLYGSGASLTTAQKNLYHEWWYDWGSSNDSIGQRVAYIRIKNNDSSAHSYFLRTKWYGHKQQI